MSAGLAGGLALALGSAVALGWGFFAQHDVASSLPPLSLCRPLRSLRSLFSDLRWLAGFLVGIGGWALYVAALRLAPLSLVQAVSAGGIGVLGLFVARAGVRLARSEWIGTGVAVAGLALLGASLAGGAAGAGRHAAPAAVATWTAASLAVAALAAAPWAGLRAGLGSGGAGLGVAAGLLYAAGDVATKAAVGGGAELAFVPVVLAAHGGAFVALQLGFQRGGALATAGLATLLTNALPIVAGTALFGEGLPDGPRGALRALAFLCVVCGAAALARPAGGGGERTRAGAGPASPAAVGRGTID